MEGLSISIKAVSGAEEMFAEILRVEGFMVTFLKEQIRAPSIQGEDDFIIIPDIPAVDKSGRGWCFEVKDERESKRPMKRLTMPHGYTGPVWLLEKRKAESYLRFSRAFKCPCIIAVRGDMRWRIGFFTHISNGEIYYNKDLVAVGWNDPFGYPVLFNVMPTATKFFHELDALRARYWADAQKSK